MKTIRSLRRSYFIFIVVLFFVCFLHSVTTANAQGKVIKLRAIDAWGPGVILNEQAFLYWIDAINKACKGRLEIQYLGGPENVHPLELLDYLQKGMIDIVDTSPVYYSESVPESEAIHFIRPDSQTSWVRDSGFWDLWNEALIKRKGIRALSFVNPRHDAMLFSRKPVTSNNFGNLKIRSPGPMVGIFIAAMGGVPQTITSAEISEALKTGICEGQIRPVEDVSTTKQYEYGPYATGPTYVSYTGEVFIGEKKWQELPDDLKKIILDTSKKVDDYQLSVWKGIVYDHMKDMIQTKKAVKYHEFSKEEFKAISAAWKKSWNEWLAPKFLPGYAAKFENALKGNAIWEEFYPTIFKDLVNN